MTNDDKNVYRPEIVDGPGSRPPVAAPGTQPFLVRYLLKLGVSAVSLWVAVQLIGGLEVDGGAWNYIWIALVFGVVNTFVGKVVKLVSLPFILMSFGFALFLINALMLELTDALVPSFHVEGFGSALLGALIVSVVSMVLNLTVVKRLR
jgi:putative membrane protein